MSNQEPQAVVIKPPKGIGGCLILFIAVCVALGFWLVPPWESSEPVTPPQTESQN